MFPFWIFSLGGPVDGTAPCTHFAFKCKIVHVNLDLTCIVPPVSVIHPLTGPVPSYWVPSAVLHLILAISRKPRRAELIELGGLMGCVWRGWDGACSSLPFSCASCPSSLFPNLWFTQSRADSSVLECILKGGVKWDSAVKKAGFLVEICYVH